MIITQANFVETLTALKLERELSLDTETTSLRPYHGGRPFSIIIGTPLQSYYFPIAPAQDAVPLDFFEIKFALQELFDDRTRLWYLQNAKFDLHMLATVGLRLLGTIHCTRAIGRVEFNEHAKYDLASQGERIGFPKDEGVEKYIADEHLWEWEVVPGKKQRRKNKHFDRVPGRIMVPYAEQDARVTFELGRSQSKTLAGIDEGAPEGIPRIGQIVGMERKLTKVVFEMERRGVLIDVPYCERARAYESNRAELSTDGFKKYTGREFIASNKLFSEIFASEKEKWVYGEPTETGQINPSFDSEVLAKFENPAARLILDYRDAKSKSDFYSGFLYHADASGVLHPNFNPDGTRTGRFSSSDPNLQNLTDEEGQEEKEFIVRRAIIPRPGHIFLMPDFDQMEYRMMLDYAAELELIAKVKGGLDVHEATAQLMGVSRKEAKTLNFMLLYGGGAKKLATALGIGIDAARALKGRYFAALPGVLRFIDAVQATVLQRGFLRNWAGRRSYFPNPEFAYTGPNTLIQGGCSDVNKFALVELSERLRAKRAHIILTIHDENPIEVAEDQAEEVAHIAKEVMENIYPGKLLRLTVGMEWSSRSLGDKRKGFPGGTEARDRLERERSHPVLENTA